MPVRDASRLSPAVDDKARAGCGGVWQVVASVAFGRLGLRLASKRGLEPMEEVEAEEKKLSQAWLFE